jgi:hypothetical protein
MGKMLGNDDELNESKMSDSRAGPESFTDLDALIKKPQDNASSQAKVGALGRLGDTLFTKVETTKKEDEKEKAVTESKDLEFEDGAVYKAS